MAADTAPSYSFVGKIEEGFGVHRPGQSVMVDQPKKENGLVGLAMWLVGFAVAVGVLVWAGVIAMGMVVLFPYGIVGLIGLAGLAIMVFVVIRDRLTSKEDDHYSKNVDQ